MDKNAKSMPKNAKARPHVPIMDTSKFFITKVDMNLNKIGTHIILITATFCYNLITMSNNGLGNLHIYYGL